MAWSGLGVVLVQKWDKRDECDGCSMAVGSDGDRSEQVQLRIIAEPKWADVAQSTTQGK